MASQLVSKVPSDIINTIKLFTGEIHLRNGKYMYRLPRDDPRYEMLKKRPRIKQVNNGAHEDSPLRGASWFKLPNNKFVVIYVKYKEYINNVRYDGYIWEMHYDKKCSVYYF